MRTTSPRQTREHHAKQLPPAAECLLRRPKNKGKGQTLLVSDIQTYDLHRRKLADPDGYRPSSCLWCGHSKLHLHDYRARVLRANRDLPEVAIARYRCASCHATFRVLPAFIARHLWRSLSTVAEETLDPSPSPKRPPVPARTIHRWNARLESQLGPLHKALLSANHPLASETKSDDSRRALVQAHIAVRHENAATSLITVAALVHELDPTQRLL